MAILTNPSVAEIKDRVKLRPEQIDPLYGGVGATPSQAVTAYEADITERIVEQSYVVEEKLLTRYSQSEMEAFTTSTQAVVELAKELLVASDLYDSAGQLGTPEQEESMRLEKRAWSLIDSVLNRPQATGTGTGAQMVTITVGENFSDADEYSDEY
jgi:hypothetical protein